MMPISPQDRSLSSSQGPTIKDPVYHTNAFMLQAVIYNSSAEKVGYLSGKLAAESEKPVSYTHLDVYKRQGIEKGSFHVLLDVADFGGVFLHTVMFFS